MMDYPNAALIPPANQSATRGLSGEGWLPFEALPESGRVPDVMAQAALAARQRFGRAPRMAASGPVTVPWRARRKPDGRS